jgi:hypothetical protein
LLNIVNWNNRHFIIIVIAHLKFFPLGFPPFVNARKQTEEE